MPSNKQTKRSSRRSRSRSRSRSSLGNNNNNDHKNNNQSLGRSRSSKLFRDLRLLRKTFSRDSSSSAANANDTAAMPKSSVSLAVSPDDGESMEITGASMTTTSGSVAVVDDTTSSIMDASLNSAAAHRIETAASAAAAAAAVAAALVHSTPSSPSSLLLPLSINSATGSASSPPDSAPHDDTSAAVEVPFDPNVSAIAPAASYDNHAQQQKRQGSFHGGGGSIVTSGGDTDVRGNTNATTDTTAGSLRHRFDSGTVMAVRLVRSSFNEDDADGDGDGDGGKCMLDGFGHPGKLSTRDRSNVPRIPSTVGGAVVCRYDSLEASTEVAETAAGGGGGKKGRAQKKVAGAAASAAAAATNDEKDGNDTVSKTDDEPTYEPEDLTLQSFDDEDEEEDDTLDLTLQGTYDDTYDDDDGSSRLQYGPPKLQESDISTLSDDTGAYLDERANGGGTRAGLSRVDESGEAVDGRGGGGRRSSRRGDGDDDGDKGFGGGGGRGGGGPSSPDREWSRAAGGAKEEEGVLRGGGGAAGGRRQQRDNVRFDLPSPSPRRRRRGRGRGSGGGGGMFDVDDASILSEASVFYLLRYCRCLPPVEGAEVEEDGISVDDQTRKIELEGMDLVAQGAVAVAGGRNRGRGKMRKDFGAEESMEMGGDRHGGGQRRLGLFQMMFGRCGGGGQG